MTRTDARELLMQAVFQMEAQKNSDTELFELLINKRDPDEENLIFIRNNFENLRRHLEEIDGKINEFAKSRNTKRMPKADLAILRVAVSELLYYDTPNSIVINEAVEMSKKFCSDESRKFVNGILGSIERNN